ncbi:MAG TPA: PssE/Cps14G family polysaccharide biosynthesis glycosyltransferase [Anaerolineae bacterium]|nr:PssE/Cps14G family polysaccharide biosynthesis glycosyltransferase [Anaerolineae bacterium]HNT06481.1 PssE/Cps14G family polysaccharide biosynthesis glycosyltransferase [Anaerolineae bacterium]
MIFVTIGSTDFDPLIVKMDQLAPTLGDRVVMQIGNGQYVPRNGAFFRFAESLDEYYHQADVIVAHGGLGTIMEVLELHKALVCVVNPTTYDRHQEHLLEVLAQQGYLLWCKDMEQLPQAVAQARAADLARYQSPPCHIAEAINVYLAGVK